DGLKRALSERRRSVARVSEVAAGPAAVLGALDRLDALSISEASSIRTRWAIQSHGQRAETEWESTEAIFDQDRLYVVPHGDGLGGTNVARELAFAISPSGVAGALAGHLLHVLMAGSAASAE